MEETYQDGTGVGLVVDKERGVFRIHVCTYHRKKKFVHPPAIMVVGGWGRRGEEGRGGTIRGGVM